MNSPGDAHAAPLELLCLVGVNYKHAAPPAFPQDSHRTVLNKCLSARTGPLRTALKVFGATTRGFRRQFFHEQA